MANIRTSVCGLHEVAALSCANKTRLPPSSEKQHLLIASDIYLSSKIRNKTLQRTFHNFVASNEYYMITNIVNKKIVH